MTDNRPSLKPFWSELGNGDAISSIASCESGKPTVVLIHDHEKDLDSVSNLIFSPGLSALKVIALDLPGHGLSTEVSLETSHSAVLAEWLALDSIAQFGPFVLAGFGRSSRTVLELTHLDCIVGIAAIEPSIVDAIDLDRRRGVVPVLGFVASQSEKGRDDWLAFKDRVKLPWTAISIPVSPGALSCPIQNVRSTIASHLGGFSREVWALSCSA